MKQPTKLVLNFIELRGQGLSIRKIAEQLQTSPTTIAQWCKKYYLEIEESKFAWLEELAETKKILKNHRIENLHSLCSKIDNEIEKTDFSRVTPTQLINMRIKLNREMKNELSTVKQIGETILDHEFDSKSRSYMARYTYLD